MGKTHKANSAKKIVSNKKLDAFIAHLERTGHINNSALAIGYSDSSYVRKVKDKDPKFAARWEAALIVAAEEVLIPEAQRRAVEGISEPIYHKGEVVGFKQRYSDALLMFLIKGAKPSTYGTHVKLDAEVNGKFGVAAIPLQAASEGDWEKDAFNVHANQKTVQLEHSEYEVVETDPVKQDPVIVRT